MSTNRDVQTFLELRNGIVGMADFAAAVLSFLDKNGIALLSGRSTNGTSARANGKRFGPALRERVKRHYTKRRRAEHVESLPPVTEATPARRTYSSKRLQDRQNSARVLEALDRTEPRPVMPEGRRSIGALVRRGYAKKKGDGYIRTAKVFAVTDKPLAADVSNDDTAIESDALNIQQAAKILKVSDSYVRLLVKQGRLTAGQEMRKRKRTHTLVPTMVLTRDEIARYQANQT